MSEFCCGECGSCLGRYADTLCQKEPVAVVRKEIWALWRHMQAVGHHTEENPQRRMVLAALYDEIQKLAERAGVLTS